MSEALKIDRIHHVAYRCKDAKETVLWYQKMLKMDLQSSYSFMVDIQQRFPTFHGIQMNLG